ncbi:HNH endonuclease [Nostoc sp. PCC 7524]|uniref:HNH endonuclease n=1 Tax=Nostoc sp. (strain ATCC 29411 / PCC 7524) TaxID=28072 RepID=UPI00029F44E2|nr:HNH endonuclease signature motif containing protein [Nostoc sp. PCC 7524]AFY47457.1 HNH endonuclease [Nostoc sp. PCC 7524]
MSNGSADNLARLYSELIVLLAQEEEIRQITAEKLSKAKSVIDPRKEFNKWLQSNAGKTWKQKQFQYQEGKCSACGESLRFADAVVHHVLPLKDFGSAANKPENFRLLHPSCNLEIGTKIVDFS